MQDGFYFGGTQHKDTDVTDSNCEHVTLVDCNGDPVPNVHPHQIGSGDIIFTSTNPVDIMHTELKVNGDKIDGKQQADGVDVDGEDDDEDADEDEDEDEDDTDTPAKDMTCTQFVRELFAYEKKVCMQLQFI